MTKVLLIHAGPTPWDVEGRLTGNRSLPLTEDATRSIEAIASSLPAMSAVFCSKSNEACEEAAKIIAERSALRPRDLPEIDAVSLGLWQGLKREQLRFRFPTAFPRWEEAPAEIIPPDGESFEHAHARIGRAVRKMIRRFGGKTIAVALRPMSQQLAAGILRGETTAQIAAHLHKVAQMETIETEAELERRLAG
jgi:broad specificity phosphatase PhoE